MRLDLCGENVPIPIRKSDAGRLRQVLQNLVNNAIQYTPPKGRIVMRARQQNKTVVICVADTGIGIPKSELGKIFERFYRVDAARSREVGGTGLGLCIARHLVEAHGGRVEVESEAGRGTCFCVILPVN